MTNQEKARLAAIIHDAGQDAPTRNAAAVALAEGIAADELAAAERQAEADAAAQAAADAAEAERLARLAELFPPAP